MIRGTFCAGDDIAGRRRYDAPRVLPSRERSDRPMPDITANDIIVHSLTGSQAMLMRFTEDLKADEYLHRPAPGANCAAWLLGHLALSDRSILSKRLGAVDLPTLPDGFEKAFSRDEGCPQAAQFGDVSILRGIFNKHRDRLIAEVKR